MVQLGSGSHHKIYQHGVDDRGFEHIRSKGDYALFGDYLLLQCEVCACFLNKSTYNMFSIY